MKALVKYKNEYGASEIRDIPIPELDDDEVLIKVKYAGICGGDPHIHHNTMSYPAVLDVPFVIGHECSGVVDKIGKKVKTIKVGDRVTTETHYGYCGECFFCKQGKYNHCKDRKGIGASVNGVFAEYVKVNQGVVHKLPDRLSLRKAVLTEPLCIAYNSVVKQTNFTGGDRVAVVGVGTMGLLSGMVAKALGASKVVVIGTERDKDRLKLAEELGLSAHKLSEFEPEELVQKYTDGLGFDLVIDAAGSGPAFLSTIKLVRREGEVTKIGFGPEPLNYSLDPFILKGVTVHFAFSQTWDVWEMSIRLLADDVIDAEKIITHELPLSEFEKGFDLIDNLEGIKVLLIP